MFNEIGDIHASSLVFDVFPFQSLFKRSFYLFIKQSYQVCVSHKVQVILIVMSDSKFGKEKLRKEGVERRECNAVGLEREMGGRKILTDKNC